MSNKITTLLYLTLFLYFASCSESVTNQGVTEVDLYEFQGFNMTSYDIPMLIMLPDETANIGAATSPDIAHIEGDFKWEINVGPNFKMIINDWGERLTKVTDEKNRLKGLKFFKIDYIKDEPNFILYKKTLFAKSEKNKGTKVGTKHESYHVFAQKQLAGINYVFESREEGYDKRIIDLMAKSILSISETTNKTN
jgi:hypothetical protein